MNVRKTFDQIATEYDTLKLRIIPGYREIQQLIERLLAQPGGRAIRVLELGTGTGLWAARFLRRHPAARYEGIEFSEKMRALAAARLEPFRGRAQLYDWDLNTCELKDHYDLVVSFFTIHHVVVKAKLIEQIYQALKVGGKFAYADIIQAQSQHLEKFFTDEWTAFMQRQKLEEARIDAILTDHWENDLPESVEQQLAYLKSAGFQNCGLVWQQGKFASFYGERE
jgi:tRNA (cmo5U34)-methyltransferase